MYTYVGAVELQHTLARELVLSFMGKWWKIRRRRSVVEKLR